MKRIILTIQSKKAIASSASPLVLSKSSKFLNPFKCLCKDICSSLMCLRTKKGMFFLHIPRKTKRRRRRRKVLTI